MINFIQQYGKELVSLSVPFIAWLLNNWFKASAKLLLARSHSFVFLVDEPLKNESGEVIQKKQAVHTASHVLINSGREPATDIELVFNWKPLCINIWPSRHFTEHFEPDDRYVMIFDSLAPGERLGFEMMSINTDLPALVNARCKQCPAKTIDMNPQPIVAQWKIRLAQTLVFVGLSASIYLGMYFLQIVFAAKIGS